MSSNRGDPKLDESFILPIRSAEIARSNPRSKKDTDSADAALAEREGFALSFASLLVAHSRLGNFLSVASCSFILPIRSAEIARSNPTSKKDTDSADAALAEREGFEPPMGLHP